MIRIPSIQECLELIEEYEMPEHIKFHSFLVRDISVFLAKELNKKNKSLDVELIEASALLHDIAKIRCVKSKERHDEVGADILRDKGYNRIAEIIGQHIRLDKGYKKITEETILFYADRRVMHDKIVSLKERFDDIKQRYAFNSKNMREIIGVTEKESYKLEKKIFKNLDFSPNELAKLVK